MRWDPKRSELECDHCSQLWNVIFIAWDNCSSACHNSPIKSVVQSRTPVIICHGYPDAWQKFLDYLQIRERKGGLTTGQIHKEPNSTVLAPTFLKLLLTRLSSEPAIAASLRLLRRMTWVFKPIHISCKSNVVRPSVRTCLLSRRHLLHNSIVYFISEMYLCPLVLSALKFKLFISS